MAGVDSTQQPMIDAAAAPPPPPPQNTVQGVVVDVDPFLVEALQNPRHRLTILRMELDVQRFLQNSEQAQFEFQHFPTSYLRLAAHRVAQHYGLQTMVLDNGIDGLVNKIVVMKTPESKYPSLLLSDIPAKQPENYKPEPVKIVIRPRPSRTSSCDAGELGGRRSVRTVEERKEEYDKARARIFSSNPGSPISDETPQVSSEPKTSCTASSTMKDEICGSQSSVADIGRTVGTRDIGGSSRVAIFRDREKDRFDPDYDRSYDRYARGFPNGQRLLTPLSMPTFQHHLVQYNAAFPQVGPIPGAQHSLSYSASDPSLNQFGTVGINQAPRDAMYMQWPSPAMMYAQSYEPFRHAVLQPPFCSQPLSFDYSQNH